MLLEAKVLMFHLNLPLTYYQGNGWKIVRSKQVQGFQCYRIT